MTRALGRYQGVGSTSSPDPGEPAPPAERAPDSLIGLAAVSVLLAVGIAQAGDLLTFVGMVALRGPGAEANPIVAHLLENLGLPALVFLKIGLMGLVAITFAMAARNHQFVAAFVATLATVVGVVGAASNLIALG
jgi:hypothetical protein